MTDDNGVCSQSPPSSVPDNVMRCSNIAFSWIERVLGMLERLKVINLGLRIVNHG